MLAHFYFRCDSGIPTFVEPAIPEFAVLKYRIPDGLGVSWNGWQACVDAVLPVFESCRRPGSLSPGLPSGLTMPLCGNQNFRNLASRLLENTPGLPFFVFGGKSELSRELFFAALPNIEAASNASGEVIVRYPSLPAQEFLHAQFTSMLEADIPESEVLRELMLLSQQCGLAEPHWA